MPFTSAGGVVVPGLVVVPAHHPHPAGSNLAVVLEDDFDILRDLRGLGPLLRRSRGLRAGLPRRSRLASAARLRFASDAWAALCLPRPICVGCRPLSAALLGSTARGLLIVSALRRRLLPLAWGGRAACGVATALPTVSMAILSKAARGVVATLTSLTRPVFSIRAGHSLEGSGGRPAFSANVPPFGPRFAPHYSSAVLAAPLRWQPRCMAKAMAHRSVARL